MCHVKLVALALLAGLVLASLACSAQPSDSVARNFVEEFVRVGGMGKVVEFKVIARGDYEQVYEYWPFTAKARLRDADHTYAYVFELWIGKDDKGSSWVLKNIDIQPIPSWRSDD